MKNKPKLSTPYNFRLLFLAGCSLCSCETNPDIMNDQAEKTLIVYGCINVTDGINQIRIRQAMQMEKSWSGMVISTRDVCPGTIGWI